MGLNLLCAYVYFQHETKAIKPLSGFSNSEPFCLRATLWLSFQIQSNSSDNTTQPVSYQQGLGTGHMYISVNCLDTGRKKGADTLCKPLSQCKLLDSGGKTMLV